MPRTVNSDIVSRLRQKILSGGFDQVAFLPPERKLAAEYQVGRGVIRGALRVLREEGILYNVPQRGLRIKSPGVRRMKRILFRMPEQMSVKAYEAIGIVSGICAGANEIFAEVLLSTPPARLNLKELQERFNADDIQGIIFLEHSPDILFEQVQDSGIPFVVANLEEDRELPCVRMDYREAGRMAGKELFRTGCRRPAVFSGSLRAFIYRALLAGFRGVAAEENVELDESRIVCSDLGVESPELERLLDLPAGERPDAIFTLRDYRAKLVYELCEKKNLRIPDDIGVVSYDNVSWPAAENYGLTSVSEEVHEIGRQSVLLLQKLYEEGCAPVTYMVPSRLIARQSLKKQLPGRRIVYPRN